jgi:ribulose bisphosphate carboxylase small subunit
MDVKKMNADAIVKHIHHNGGAYRIIQVGSKFDMERFRKGEWIGCGTLNTNSAKSAIKRLYHWKSESFTLYWSDARYPEFIKNAKKN